MIYTDCISSNFPLSVIGKAKTPACFPLATNVIPPMKYKDHKNAWFDKKITMWWINCTFFPTIESSTAILKPYFFCKTACLTAFICHSYPKVSIFFLPLNITSNNQPSDMGMINSLTVGYKILFW